MNGRPFSSDRKGHAVLVSAGIVILAVLLRLLFFLKLQDTPFFYTHFSDSRLYAELAQDIVSGAGIDRAFFMSPLYPYLLSGIQTVFGSPETVMRVLQMIFGGVTAFLTYRLGTRQFGEAAGIIAGLTVAVYAPFIYYDGFLLIESLLTLLFTGFLLCMSMALEKRRMRLWLCSGVLFGLAVVTRANILLFLPVFIVFWMFSGPWKEQIAARHIALWAVATGLLILPTTIHNAVEEGVFLPVTASFGYNLYAGNNAEADGFYSMPEPVDLYTDPNGETWVERQEGRALNSSEVSDWWRDRALVWMGNDPGGALQLLLRKIVLFFHPGAVDQLGLSQRFFTERYGTVIGVPPSVFPLLLFLGFVGAGFAVGNRKGGWLLPLFFLTYIAATALFFVNARFRLPIMPVMILYAGYAAAELFRILKTKQFPRSARIPVLLGAVSAALLLLLQPEVVQTFSQEYLRLGQTSFNDGDYAAAERAFRASIEEESTSDGWTNLGNALAAQKRMGEAADMYRTALRIDSTHALTWFNFGNLWMQTGKPQYAFGYWKKAIEQDPLLADAHRNLGLLLIRAGRIDEARSALRKYVKLERDPGKRAEIEADLRNLDALPSSP